MKLASIELKETQRFSSVFTDYINQDPKLKDFYNLYPTTENFEKQIAQKKFSDNIRKVLSHVLTKQYEGYEKASSLNKNLELLTKSNTFTVTTGHQLNIFTGPLYFIYKIVTVVNTCRELTKQYPEYNFVPVYWMASEDHDFDEINHFWLNDEKYQWQTDQEGAVGRFTTEQLALICDKIPGMPELFKEAYKNYDTLADAGRCYVNKLFGEEGLVVIDADDPDLKKLFVPVIKDDVFQHTANQLVTKQTAEIESDGYSTQVFPREINFFYLGRDFRERIEKVGEQYQVLNTDLVFDVVSITQEIEENPERFSPNVVLRPLYQEVILPNLAYIGGPSEVAYWFQLKTVFEHYETAFPILMPRNFAAFVTNNTVRKKESIGFDWDKLFIPAHELHKTIALKTTEKKIALNGQKDQVLQIFDGIRSQAESIDATLVAHVKAQAAKISSRLDDIEKKFIRAEKRNHSDKIKQIDAVLEVLFPAGSLQERRDNFLNFYMEDPQFVKKLLAAFDPFDFRFHILLHGQQTDTA